MPQPACLSAVRGEAYTGETMAPLSRPLSARCLAALLIALAAVLAAAPAAAATAARAIVAPELMSASVEDRARLATELGGQLRARFIRFDVPWAAVEPERGVYDETYLDTLEAVADAALANGSKLVLTFAYTPEWASDSALWNDPPFGYSPGVYQPIYAPRADAAADYGAMVATVAARLKDKVFAYEAWNEPNLWLFLYPQQVTGDHEFAVRRYARLLRACHDAVHGVGDVGGADPAALVIGGTTSPIGEGDDRTPTAYRTRPAYWAQVMKDLDLASYFDAYSHHPYVPGGTADVRPEAMPSNPRTTVNLANIDDLLEIFPGKDFYLTEFGYNTDFSAMFGGKALTQAQQADYLRRSYSVVGRHEQIKALFWYLRRDHSPSGKAGDRNGVYTGLRTVTNDRKRSWYAFAGGMRLTLSARSPVPAGDYTKLSGTLTCSRLATATSPGGVSGKTLDVQRRVDGRWKAVKTVRTRSGGHYATWVRLGGDARLRVVWRGVVTGPARFVDVR